MEVRDELRISAALPRDRSLWTRSLRGFLDSRADLDALENGESLTLIGESNGVSSILQSLT